MSKKLKPTSLNGVAQAMSLLDDSTRMNLNIAQCKAAIGCLGVILRGVSPEVAAQIHAAIVCRAGKRTK